MRKGKHAVFVQYFCTAHLSHHVKKKYTLVNSAAYTAISMHIK